MTDLAKVKPETVGSLAKGYLVLIHPPDDPDHFMVLYRTASKLDAEMYAESLNVNLRLCLEAAHREGAEAMRSEAIECCYMHYSIDGTAQKIEAEIRALPLPGDE